MKDIKIPWDSKGMQQWPQTLEELMNLEVTRCNVEESDAEYFGYDPIEKITEEAESYNCDVIVAQSNQLMLDIDIPYAKDGWPPSGVNNLLELLQDKVESFESWPSKSNNTHVVVNLKDHISVFEQIALQAIGGSDPKREYAALQCALLGSPHPILLFKPNGLKDASAQLDAKREN